MRQFLLIAFLGMYSTFFGQTQGGTIIDEQTNEPVYGAAVIEKNTENKTRTATDGTFLLNLSKTPTTIVVSISGYTTKEILVSGGVGLNISITMEKNLDEIVVTALALERSTKDLGYAVQTVSGEDLSEVKSPNILDNLAGKISGVTISQGASGVGSTTKIIIRGEQSFRNNNPLFVVDGIVINNNSIVNPTDDDAAGFQSVDFGNGAMEINADDIASVSVLKGPAAAALYGTRASNGVVIFTTKSGSKEKGLGISFNSTTTFDNAFKLPDFQNKYGQGNNGQFAYKDGLGGGINDGISYSWGPKLNNGYMTTQFDSPVYLSDGTVARGADFALVGNTPITPTEMIAHPDNLKDFYRTGLTSIQNVAISNGWEKGDMRISMTDMHAKGILPGVNLDRTNFQGKFNFNPTNKLRFSSSIQYANSRSDNRPASGYGSENLQYSIVAWGPRSLDINALKDYWQPGFEGLQQYSFNYTFFDNPYFMLYENRNSFKRDRLIGNLVANYQITPELTLTVRTGMDYSSEKRQLRRAYSSNRFKQGAYAEHFVDFRENNTDFLLNYAKKIKEFKFDVSVGGNRMDQTQGQSQFTASALAQPGIYQLSNSAVPLVVNQYTTAKRINSLYALAKLSYKNFAYLDLTGRNDWSSALATPTSTENVSFFYPSASGAFIFSNLFQLPKQISFLKGRISYAQVGNDTDPYQTAGSFIPQVAYNSQPTFSANSIIPNANLLPEKTTSFEVGGDLRFFRDRIRLDATYYNAVTRNQIISLPVAASSGYNTQIVNGGVVRSIGVELFASVDIYRKESFKWIAGFNFSKNVSTVSSLPDGANKITLAYNRIYDNVNQTVWYQVEEGGRIGDMYGTGYKKTEDGQFIIDGNGNYIPDNNLKKLGNYNPDFILSWTNDLSYKNFSFNFLFDWRQGGVIVSRTQALAGVGGQLIETEDRPEGGIVAEGVVNVGTASNPEYVQNTKPITAESYYRQFYDRNHEENNTMDASYLKLRQFAVSYTFKNPTKTKGFISDTRTLQVSIIGRNLFAISKIKHFDPEQLATQGQQFTSGVENMSYATTRSFGIKFGYNF